MTLHGDILYWILSKLYKMCRKLCKISFTPLSRESVSLIKLQWNSPHFKELYDLSLCLQEPITSLYSDWDHSSQWPLIIFLEDAVECYPPSTCCSCGFQRICTSLRLFSTLHNRLSACGKEWQGHVWAERGNGSVCKVVFFYFVRTHKNKHQKAWNELIKLVGCMQMMFPSVTMI